MAVIQGEPHTAGGASLSRSRWLHSCADGHGTPTPGCHLVAHEISPHFPFSKPALALLLACSHTQPPVFCGGPHILISPALSPYSPHICPPPLGIPADQSPRLCWQVLLNSLAFEIVVLCMFYSAPSDGPMVINPVAIIIGGLVAAAICIPGRASPEPRWSIPPLSKCWLLQLEKS